MRIHGPDYVIQRTQSDIYRLSAAVKFYRFDYQYFPESLSDLIEAEVIYGLYPDPYGSDYNYRVDPDEADFVIYSSGPDRTDEAGGGDDIVLTGKEYDCPIFYRCPTLCERSRNYAFIGGVLLWPVAVIALLVWGGLAGFRWHRKWRCASSG